ncbi:LysR family transcriptional regulator [Methylobacterium terricola]|uniref:LysR family transcriptional regulator n=1 Tax=Methylobacterium terricola TaxID=2583531 RepID=A0A5C4LAZ2_9HYPH|nr:LysR substrate-binding domain-containing protein [Methylobacterium terricola]TNC10060.1 LysR family transcriptional regulator [Methylobacterium terricola]
MNLRQVEAFRVVMLRGSMTAAAQALRTSQPSVSRLIAELEATTGLRLFEREAGRLRPTDEGLSFYREVERSFLGLENLAQAAREIRVFGSGRLRVAAMPVMALGFIPRCIRRFRERFPNVAISLQMGSDGTVMRWMSASYCDIGFMANVVETPFIEHRPLYTIPGLCALPPGHRLTERAFIVPEDLEGEPFISLSLEDGARMRVDRAFEAAGIGRQMMLETPFGATICALVEQGLGVGIVNPIAADDYRRSGIAFRPFRPEIPFHGHALFPSRHLSNPLIDGFLAVVHEELAGYDTTAPGLVAGAPDF